MAYVLNEEQSMLKDSAKEFLKNNAPVAQLRQLRDDNESKGYNESTWQQMVEMGWTALTIPEEYEGMNFGYLGLGQILEESGRTLTSSPLLSSAAMATTAINIAGSEVQKKDYLTRLSHGEIRATLAIDETARHNPNVIKSSLQSQNGSFLLNGTKVFVPDANISDFIIVSCIDASGNDSMVILDSKSDGITITREHLMDYRNYGTVELNNVKVSSDQILANSNKQTIERTLDVARVAVAAELYGSSVEAFERSVAYLKERKQFGVELATFQGLQHRCAIMFCELELAQSAVLNALNAIDRGEKDIRLAASTAKAKVCKVAQLVSNEGVQLFGGIGMTDDEEIGFFLKRARVGMAMLGDYNFHLDRFAVLNGY